MLPFGHLLRLAPKEEDGGSRKKSPTNLIPMTSSFPPSPTPGMCYVVVDYHVQEIRFEGGGKAFFAFYLRLLFMNVRCVISKE